MTTASPIAKVSIGRSGCGAAHASYITRMFALDPEGRDRAKSDEEERFEQLSLLTHDETEKTEPSVTETLTDNLDHRSLDVDKEHGGGSHVGSAPTHAAEPVEASLVLAYFFSVRRDVLIWGRLLMIAQDEVRSQGYSSSTA